MACISADPVDLACTHAVRLSHMSYRQGFHSVDTSLKVGSLLSDFVPGYVQLNTLLRASKIYTIRFDIHILKQQEVVTYVSPVEVFATEIKIVLMSKNCP